VTADRSAVVANAGSGKTYLLANRIVRWMMAGRGSGGPSSPEEVLAITFTRKAAGEIVERVLLHLAQGATSEARRDEFAAEGQVGRFTAEQYAAALDRFVDAMHRVSISTIDGFFVQLAGAFAPELAMPEEWRIGDEHELDDLRTEAVGAVIAADPARAVELARRIGDGAPKAQVQSAIDAVLADALELWSRAGLRGDPRAPWEAAFARCPAVFPCGSRAKPEAVEAAIEGLATAPVPPKNERGWRGAVARVRALAAAGDWFGVLKDPFMRKLQCTGEFHRQEPPPGLERCLSVIRAHACAEAERAVRPWCPASSRRRAVAPARTVSATSRRCSPAPTRSAATARSACTSGSTGRCATSRSTSSRTPRPRNGRSFARWSTRSRRRATVGCSSSATPSNRSTRGAAGRRRSSGRCGARSGSSRTSRSRRASARARRCSTS
jgi:hypothetical protein